VRGADRRVVLGLHRSDHRRQLLEDALTAGIRALDTASNYRDFTAHQTLADGAGDLLGSFTISTKVGFFRQDSRVEHSLDPTRLRDAVTRAVDELGRVPDAVLLHSPERSLRGDDPRAAGSRLRAACAVLQDAVAAGLCAAWGISSWDSGPLGRALDASRQEAALPRPDVLMVRAGLAVAGDGLAASEHAAALLAVPSEGRWGMSPFAGDAGHPAWQRISAGIFLRPNQQAGPLPAAFRLAFELPRVAAVAVGSADPRHLREFAAAVDLEVDSEQVARYRRLLAARQPQA
jgi:aryl-alcohol dehydrogenase-like predicted oxidoreductase